MAERKRRKIALVGLTHPFRGGIAHYTTLLYRALAESHEVRFFALSRQYPRLLFPGVSQIDPSGASLRVPHEASIDSIHPWTWFSTSRAIVRFGPDLALFSWWHPFFAPCFGTIARRLRRAGGVPSCFLCHNAFPHERSAVDRVLLSYAFHSADVFITHSKRDHDDLKAFRPDAIVRQSPHPTYEVFDSDPSLTEAAARERLGLAGKRVLLFFGFVREYKGLAYLLEAVEALDPTRGYHLVIVGEFYDDRRSYAAALARLADRGQLTLVDRYVPNEEVGAYFKAADLVMVPYLSATQSGVIQIAYAFGKPVVATAVGGIPEVVVDDRTGYLVPPADGRAIAAAVTRHFERDRDSDFRRAIAEENHKYSWERMVETVEDVCRELGR